MNKLFAFLLFTTTILTTACNSDNGKDEFSIGTEEIFVNVFNEHTSLTLHCIERGDTVYFKSERPFMVTAIVTNNETKNIYDEKYDTHYKYQEETIEWLTVKHPTDTTLEVIADKNSEYSEENAKIKICTTLADYNIPEHKIVFASNNTITLKIMPPAEDR